MLMASSGPSVGMFSGSSVAAGRSVASGIGVSSGRSGSTVSGACEACFAKRIIEVAFSLPFSGTAET